ncbi:hypothetical protein HYX01_02630, partial [Candidatus Woesearchaeota archaeon]|nr:hypothetical protein [Candidatus Woesearchaeota archaeon]
MILLVPAVYGDVSVKKVIASVQDCKSNEGTCSSSCTASQEIMGSCGELGEREDILCCKEKASSTSTGIQGYVAPAPSVGKTTPEEIKVIASVQGGDVSSTKECEGKGVCVNENRRENRCPGVKENELGKCDEVTAYTGSEITPVTKTDVLCCKFKPVTNENECENQKGECTWTGWYSCTQGKDEYLGECSSTARNVLTAGIGRKVCCKSVESQRADIQKETAASTPTPPIPPKPTAPKVIVSESECKSVQGTTCSSSCTASQEIMGSCGELGEREDILCCKEKTTVKSEPKAAPSATPRTTPSVQAPPKPETPTQPTPARQTAQNEERKCDDGIDNDLDAGKENGGIDYDGKWDAAKMSAHGDKDCPVEITDIDIKILAQGPYFDAASETKLVVYCESTVKGVRSVHAYVDDKQCVWNSWNGNKAKFTCNLGSQIALGEKTIRCKVNEDISYKKGEDKTMKISACKGQCSENYGCRNVASYLSSDTCVSS